MAAVRGGCDIATHTDAEPGKAALGLAAGVEGLPRHDAAYLVPEAVGQEVFKGATPWCPHRSAAERVVDHLEGEVERLYRQLEVISCYRVDPALRSSRAFHLMRSVKSCSAGVVP